MLSWREQIRQIATDRESGASQIARNCAQVLITYLEQEQPDSNSQLNDDLWGMARDILTGQPSMAPVVGVLNQALLFADASIDPATTCQQLKEYAADYISEGHQLTRRIAEIALHVFPQDGTVITLSRSAAVANALAYAAQRGHHLRVICLESRPNYEGRAFAAWLSDQGLDSSVVVDAAAYDGLLCSDLFIAGADSLTDQGVVNKIGTALVAVAAHALRTPVYVLADQTKIWPSCLGLPPITDHPHSEVWEDAPAAVKVENRYFDLTPWDCWSGVVTEKGLLVGRDIAALCQSIPTDQRIESHFV